jgi:hypothetical protein
MIPWNAATWRANTYATRKPAPKPVGEHRYVHSRDHVDGIEDESCRRCGYHVCSCARAYDFPIRCALENGQTDLGANAFVLQMPEVAAFRAHIYARLKEAQ